MARGQTHDQIDQQAASPAGLVVARAGPMGAPVEMEVSRASNHTPFAVAFPLASANARDRMGPPSRVPVARTPKLHVDDFLGHDATRMGAGGQLVGLPLIFDRLDHVAQHASPIPAHHHQPQARPACRDGGNMPELKMSFTLQHEGVLP